MLLAVAVGMFGFGFALVPLYGLFCRVAGVETIEQRSAAFKGQTSAGVPDMGASERRVTVKFDGTVNPDLPWAFNPLERKVEVRLGELREVRFTAENRSSQAITGQAIPSVAPWEATPYFSKLECFCFTSQTLAARENREMPVRFVVSPLLPAGIQSLTVSYNFLRTADAAASASRAGL
jgi:cytochrome c oxidase assembly protein subunit 11